MAELTIEQKRAIAVASARLRLGQSSPAVNPNQAILDRQAAQFPTAAESEKAAAEKPFLNKVGTFVAEEGPAMAGGALGGSLGAPLGPPGIAVGATIGGMGGEALRQLFNRGVGLPSPATPTEASARLLSGAATGLGQSTGAMAGAMAGPKVAEVLAGGLKTGAVKSMSQVLGATTNENKAISQRIVPEMLRRRITALTEKGLQKQAVSGIETAGDALDTALAAVSGTKTVDTVPILKAMAAYKDEFVVAGSKVIGDNRGHAMAEAQIGKIMELVKEQGPDVSFESLRSLRMILDKAVKAGKGFGGKTVTEGTELDATRKLSGAIRSELAKAEPSIAKINAEYSFWKNVDQVISAKITRQLSQSKPLGQQLLTGAGVAGGLAKGGVSGAVSAGLAMKTMAAALRSTAWKTVSARGKNTVADLLAKGHVQQAASIAGALTGVGVARTATR